MESLILLLSKILLFLCTVILAVDEKSGSTDSLTNEGRLPDNIIPLHYQLHLDLSNTLISNSECRITISIKHPTRQLSLYADRLQIQEFKFLSIKSIGNSTKQTRLRNYWYEKETHINTYIFNVELHGYYELHFLYANPVQNTEIFFKIPIADIYGNRAWILGIDLWPTGARHLLPCWDEPTFPANFNISIRHYTNYTILSNMQMQDSFKTDELNVIWTHFVTTPRIPTYHVSAILLPYFTTLDMPNIHMKYRLQLNINSIRYTCDTLDEIMKYFKMERYLNSEIIISHVVIPGIQYSAVSNLGLIFYREMDVILDHKKDPLMRRIDIARLLGRAVAYQCLRKRFGPTSWTYTWLNQAISTLLAMDAIDKVYPFYQIKDLFVVQTVQESLRLDTNSIMKPLVSEIHSLSDINSIHFSFACYIKGPVILRMLQHMLQEDVFQNGIKRYLNYDSYSETNIKVFWTAMQAAYDEQKSNVEYLDVRDTMEAWLMQEHYPIMNVKQYSNFVEITTYNINTTKWWIPYTATTNNALNFSLTTPKVYFTPWYILRAKGMITHEEFHIYDEEGGWLMVNLQQIGYYRVNYDARSLKNIRNSLNSHEYTNIHVLNRAQIMDDAFHFMLEGQLDWSVFENLTTYLLWERSYIAWYPVFKAFEYMSSSLPFKKDSNIKSKMASILDHLHEQIWYEETEMNPKLHNINGSSYYLNSLKQEIARWACAFGSSECRKHAYIKLETDLRRNNNSILPWWKEWTYCNGLRTADNVTWDKVFNMYTKNPDYTLLKFLACSEDFSIIRKYLSLVASKHYDEVIKDHGRIYIFHSVIARHAKNDTVLDYILANFDEVIPRRISKIVALVDIVNHVYSEDSVHKMYKFLLTYSAFTTRPAEDTRNLLMSKLYLRKLRIIDFNRKLVLRHLK